MTFTSLTFLIFLPIVFLTHWLKQNRHWQNLILVLASYFFYGWWDVRFCALLLGSSLIDYGVGLFIHRSDSPVSKKVGLTVSIVSNLSLLGFFKYYNFFTENLVAALGEFGWTVHPLIQNIILPVGISFYTFQTLSYTIDIYFQKLEPARDIIQYLAFVSFFPQLVAGPIERATHLLPQFNVPRKFQYSSAVDGCQLILWGFLKKLVIADRLASVVDVIYQSPTQESGMALAIATIFFAIQIYCDFSAYSDIAIGTAKLFGVSLMRNFDYPYFSQSVTEFWRRWHISLSTWFRDYVFIPLGGSHGTRARTEFNLLLTFVLSGLWHGAAWKFIVWGLINAVALIVERRLNFKPSTQNSSALPITAFLKTSATFATICFGWIFFRANSIDDAFHIVKKIFRIPSHELFNESVAAALINHRRLVSCAIGLLVFLAIEWFSRNQQHPLAKTKTQPILIRWGTYTAMIWITLHLMLTSRLNPFIYFTF